MIELLHSFVSVDGSGTVFEIKIDGCSFIVGFISAFDHELVCIGGRRELTPAEVAEYAEAWKLAAETVELHAHCFIWKLEVQIERAGERTFVWYIWAPTAEIAYERMLGDFAKSPPVGDIEETFYRAAMKAVWERA